MKPRKRAARGRSRRHSTPLDREARLQLASSIRQARLAAGLTLEALAIRIGFASYKPLWLIETGRMPIPPEKTRRLEEVLGFPRNSVLWKECRCRLLHLGFNVDWALEGEETILAAADPATPGPAPEEPQASPPLPAGGDVDHQTDNHGHQVRQEEVGQVDLPLP